MAASLQQVVFRDTQEGEGERERRKEEEKVTGKRRKEGEGVRKLWTSAWVSDGRCFTGENAVVSQGKRKKIIFGSRYRHFALLREKREREEGKSTIMHVLVSTRNLVVGYSSKHVIKKRFFLEDHLL